MAKTDLLNVLIDAARQAGFIDTKEAQAEERERVAERARAQLQLSHAARFDRLLGTAERVCGTQYFEKSRKNCVSMRTEGHSLDRPVKLLRA